MAVEDIQKACDLIKPVFDASDGKDGFVSLEKITNQLEEEGIDKFVQPFDKLLDTIEKKTS